MGVVDEALRGEGELPDRRVNDAGLVDAELHLAGLDLLDRLRDVRRDRAGLRVRHEAARTEHLAEAPDAAHHVRRRDHGVEVHPSTEDLLDDLVTAHEVGARVLRFLLLVRAGNRQHALALAEPVGQDDRAAHHLVRMLRIDAEPQGHFHRLVELGELHLLNQGNRLLDGVLPVLDLRGGRREFLAVFCHVPPCGANGTLARASHGCRRV